MGVTIQIHGGEGGDGGGAVDSVNGKTGVVQLNNNDIPESFRYLPNWTAPATAIPKNTITQLNGWLSIALTDTFQYPVPRPNGDAFYLFDGTLLNQSQSAKQIILGSRYINNVEPAYVKGYRLLDVVAGNRYEVYSIRDPLGAKIINSLAVFKATVSGEVALNIEPIILGVGIAFDLVYRVIEPDPAPTTFNGDWDYQTATSVVIPLAGQITQRSNQSSPMRVNKIDFNGTDRSVELANLTIGDVINQGGTSWAIQSILDNGSDYTFAVLPEIVSQDLGVQNFIFETVAVANISYGEDVDYYLGNANVRGLFIKDDTYGNILANDNAYGVDILVQKADIPTEWGVLSNSSATAGAATTSTNPNWAQYSDTQYTDVSPFSVVGSAAAVVLPNNSLSSIESYMPVGIKFYDGITKKITPEAVGENYLLRISFKANSSTNQNYLTIDLDIGGGQGIIFEEVISFPRGAGIDHSFSTTTSLFALGTFIANGGGLLISADDNITVWDITYLITRV